MMRPADHSAVLIRDLISGDEAEWRRLWSGYLAFYETELSETVTASTWQRLVTPGSPMFGRIAECQGAERMTFPVYGG